MMEAVVGARITRGGAGVFRRTSRHKGEYRTERLFELKEERRM